MVMTDCHPRRLAIGKNRDAQIRPVLVAGIGEIAAPVICLRFRTMSATVLTRAGYSTIASRTWG